MKAITTLFLIGACFCLVSAVAPPTWPKQYYARTVFSIPYWNISEPIDVWYDGVNNRQRTDYYAGMASYVWRFDQQVMYEVVPKVDVMNCFQGSLGGSDGITTVLPDLSQWIYAGIEPVRGINCHKYVNIVRNFNTTANYNFFVNAKTFEPVQIYLFGYDFVFHSHPDIYILDFIEYEGNLVSDQVFNKPGVCLKSERTHIETDHAQRQALRAAHRLGRFNIFTPPTSDDHFEHFSKMHGKIYHTQEEKNKRMTIFRRNQKMIEKHNANPKNSYKLAMNKYGDFTQDELKVLMRPSVKRTSVESAVPHVMGDKRRIPSAVNWVKRGAVNPPKDQGICGSCWTFGTAGTIEGAYFVKTGKLLSLSEQQLVDCAWDLGGDSACDGGFSAGAMQFIINNGGIALEQTYRYIMLDHVCNTEDRSSGVQLKGIGNVTSGSEEALKDAVARFGPVSIAIDASHPSFTYYTSGVYDEPACKNGPNDLDHEVLVVGYGTENGKDYWLVKNSWSTYWGDGGYIKMSRNNNNQCGIATQANYPIL